MNAGRKVAIDDRARCWRAIPLALLVALLLGALSLPVPDTAPSVASPDTRPVVVLAHSAAGPGADRPR